MATKAKRGRMRIAPGTAPDAPEEVYYLRLGRTPADVRRTPATVVRRTNDRVVIRYHDDWKGPLTVCVRPDRVVPRRKTQIQESLPVQCEREIRDALRVRDMHMTMARGHRATGYPHLARQHVKDARRSSGLLVHWKQLARQMGQQKQRS